MGVLLIQNRVQRQRGFAGLAVANNQFALPAPNRYQEVNRLQPGLHRLMDGFARQNARRLDIHRAALGGFYRPLAVQRIAERVHHAPQQRLAHRHIHNRAGALDHIALAYGLVGAENHHADIVVLQIERHAARAIGEGDHFAGLHPVQPMDARNPVAHRKHAPDLHNVGRAVKIRNLRLQNVGNFGRFNIHRPPLSFFARRAATARAPTHPSTGCRAAQ